MREFFLRLRLFCMRIFARNKVDRAPGIEFGIVYSEEGGELDG